jgi:hypothetical protein
MDLAVSDVSFSVLLKTRNDIQIVGINDLARC